MAALGGQEGGGSQSAWSLEEAGGQGGGGAECQGGGTSSRLEAQVSHGQTDAH